MSNDGWTGTDKLRIEIVTTFRDGTESRKTVEPPDDPRAVEAAWWAAQIDEFGNVWFPTNDDNETVVWA